MDRDEESECMRQELQHLQQAFDQLPKPGTIYDDIIEAAKQLSATKESLQSIVPKMMTVKTVHEQTQVQIMKCQLLMAELEKTRLEFLLIQSRIKSLYDTANLLININSLSRLEWNAMLQTAADGPEIPLDREALEEVIEEQLKLVDDYKNTLNSKQLKMQEEEKLKKYDLESEMRSALSALKNACENVLQTPRMHDEDDEKTKEGNTPKTDKEPRVDNMETPSSITKLNTYQASSNKDKPETIAGGASKSSKDRNVSYILDTDESQRRSKDIEEENVVRKLSEEGEEDMTLQPSGEREENSEGLEEDPPIPVRAKEDDGNRDHPESRGDEEDPAIPARANEDDGNRDHPESRGDEESQPLRELHDDEENRDEGEYHEMPRLVDDDEVLELIDELYDEEESSTPRTSPGEAEAIERGEMAKGANNEVEDQIDEEQRSIEEGRALELQREKREIQRSIDEMKALIRQLEERPTCPPRRLQNRAIYREADRFIRCVYCETTGRHYSDSCPVVRNSADRMRLLDAQRRCHICFNVLNIVCPGGRWCRKWPTPCYHCRRYGHHTSVCRLPDESSSTRERLKRARNAVDRKQARLQSLEDELRSYYAHSYSYATTKSPNHQPTTH